MLHDKNAFDPSPAKDRPLLGVIGFGAFGQLIAKHLSPFFQLRVHDPVLPMGCAVPFPNVAITPLAATAACPVVILATPVSGLETTLTAITDHVRPGALVLDVGSVKMLPAEIMQEGLPTDVDIVATHPLFGPQSARAGIAGLKIVVCPVRGRRTRAVVAFLRRKLRLQVIVTTPEAHDREAALVQGLTHLIAKVIVAMEPLPTSMTTRSFDLMVEAIGMVRHDAPAVFQAIEQSNPFSPAVRRRFIELATMLTADLDEGT
jgi:prephenate dehydrogenase